MDVDRTAGSACVVVLAAPVAHASSNVLAPSMPLHPSRKVPLLRSFRAQLRDDNQIFLGVDARSCLAHDVRIVFLEPDVFVVAQIEVDRRGYDQRQHHRDQYAADHSNR